jgi:hypothetical protein
LFVWLGLRLGFYETWCLLFNVVISIYLAVFLAPTVAELAPITGAVSAYGTALSMVVLGGGCFAILYGLSYVFLTSQYTIPFPKIIDILVAGGLGFLCGFLVLSFLALIVTITPLAQHGLVRSIGFNPEAEQANTACLAWCCDLVHSFASPGATEGAAQAAIDHLLDAATETAPAKRAQGPDQPPPIDPNVPE